MREITRAGTHKAHTFEGKQTCCLRNGSTIPGLPSPSKAVLEPASASITMDHAETQWPNSFEDEDLNVQESLNICLFLKTQIVVACLHAPDT